MVVTAIDVADVLGKEVLIDAFQRRNIDRDRVLAVRPHAVGMRANAAGRADVIGQVRLLAIGRGPAILNLIGLAALRVPEPLERSESEPGARLATQGAVAAHGALFEIEIDFVADRAAMASAFILLFRHSCIP